MNGLMAWMEKYILPTAAKIGAQKHLVALRDALLVHYLRQWLDQSP